MKTSEAGRAIIREYEGFRAEAYLCPAGVPTIGYGSTRWADGRKVTLGDGPITRDQADALLAETLVGYEREVDRIINIELQQREFDALVSFAYNLGARNLEASTLRRMLNAGNRAGAADEFLKWNKAGGQVLAGLTRRRQAERALFLGLA